MRSQQGRYRDPFFDISAEALRALSERPSRSLFTALGTALGIASLVAITGLASSASAQVSKHFDALAATTVTLQDQTPNASNGFPKDTDRLLGSLHGVSAAGLLSEIEGGNRSVSFGGGAAESDLSGNLYAATPGLFAAVGAKFSSGSALSAKDNQRGEQFVVLGRGAAAELGIKTVGAHQSVQIDGIPFTVRGVMSDALRRPDLLLAVIVPQETALSLFGPTSSAQAIVTTVPGAAELVGQQAPVLLHPEAPKRILALIPPDPRLLRTQVSSDLKFLLIGLGSICLLVGLVSITNTTLVSVLERTSEIGLRRAEGARKREIRRQFMAESTLLGALGSSIGLMLGLFAIVGFCVIENWTATLNPLLPPGAFVLGIVIGAVAGIYPAAKAASYSPADALRR